MDAVKKVLYITYDGLTDPLGQSQVLPYLLELSKNGYSFTIISFEKKHRYLKEAEVIRSMVGPAGIEWIPLRFTSKPPVLSKMYDRMRMWKKALSLYKQKRFDMLHCRSYVAAEIGLRLKKKFGVKFLFDMRGFWADEKVDNGQWNLKHLFFRNLYKHYKGKEKEFLLAADGIVSLTQAAKQYLISQRSYASLLIEVIPCCADLDHFNYQKIDRQESILLKERLGIPATAKVISYLGSVGGWYMTKEMFMFFKHLLLNDSSYHMLVLTKDDEASVKAEAELSGVPPDKLTITYVERKHLPLYLSLSKYSIFFIRNTFSKIASSPTKHAELMGMGIPVICNDIGDTGNIVNAGKVGVLIKSFDEEGIKEAIKNMECLEDMAPEAIRSYAFEHFDLHKGVDRYQKVYNQILSKL